MGRLLAGCLLILLSIPSHAGLITGGLSVVGAGTLNTTADTFQFSNGFVVAASGDFAPTLFSAVSWSPTTLDYSQPFSSPISFSVGGFTIAISALSITFENASQVGLLGGATASGNGFSPTPIAVNMTLNSSSYSSDYDTVAVPEPATLSLLGLCLLMIGVFSKFGVSRDSARR